METGEAILEDHEYHDREEAQDLVETLLKKDSHKMKTTWERELIQEVERYVTLEGMHR